MPYTAPIDEKQLIADLQDPKTANDGFRTLMQTYGEKMYWQIRRLVNTHAEADDLLQNSFIKAWSNISNFRGEAKLSTWLMKIAVNEAINHINREKRKATVSDSDPAAAVMERLEADPYFDGDELQKQLQGIIATLPEKQRLVFNMRYYDDMKYEEISDILGTSVGALKASYHHALKKVEEGLRSIDVS